MAPPPFAAQDRMKALLAQHFSELEAASLDPGRKVAWCTSVGPAELLLSFGFQVYFPENHGALLGASRRACEFMPLAQRLGYSPDVCSYLTSDVGAYLAGDTPLKKAYGLRGIPRPDILVFNTNQCRDVQDWFAFYSRELRAPLVGVSSPVKVGAVTRELVDGMAAQYRALIPSLELASGERFDIDRLRETLRTSARTTQLWKSVLRAARHRPSPLTFFDAAILMGPAVVLRGDRRAAGFYQGLAAEVEGRILEGVAAVPGERHRLCWEGMPIWGKLRDLAAFFQGLRGALVVSTYCNSWVFDAFEGLDLGDPFEAMARAYLELFIARSDAAKEEILAGLLADFSVDGIVYHEAKTCPNNTNTRYGLPQRLKEKTGIPYVIIYGDINDLRCYSEEQAKTSLEAFAEQLGG